MGVIGPEARRVVDQQRLCFVATVNEDGTPNLSPKGTISVLDDDHLAFGDIRSPRTIQNLRRRPAIELNIVNPISRKGYRFRGTAAVVDPGRRFEELVAFFRSRGLTNPMHCAVVIAVDRAESVISPAYDDGMTEPEVRARWQKHFAEIEDGIMGYKPGHDLGAHPHFW